MKIAKPNIDVKKEQHIPKEYMDVAKGFERQFAKQLIEEMKKTVERTEEQSTGEKIFESLLDDEYAQTLADSERGLGIKDMVLEQIYPQRMRNKDYTELFSKHNKL
jgi:Rod binding domain-containing protein